MAFTIRICPYCGADVSVDESGVYVCAECGKRTYRSRSNSTAFLINKPYEDSYNSILTLKVSNPEKALEQIEELMSSVDEPIDDMYFTRGIIYCSMGEEGKALNDWRKGLSILGDVRYIDAYIAAVCKQIAELIVAKELEFIEFNPVEYIDLLSTEFTMASDVPCRGVFYITVYRNLRMMHQGGALDDDPELYQTIIPKIMNRIISYGRNCRTIAELIEEVLEDLHYNPETYEEDENLNLHMWELLMNDIKRLSANFSEEHYVRIFKHWNDDNMFELEYWLDELLNSIDDSSILQRLRALRSSENDEFNLEIGVEDYAKKYLLLSDEGEDLSKEA